MKDAKHTASITSALVDLRSGRAVGDASGAVVDVAPVVAELYAADHAAWAYAAFESALDGEETSALGEIVIVGDDAVHVLQRLPWDPERALVTIGPWERQPGAVVASAREELARREGQR